MLLVPIILIIICTIRKFLKKTKHDLPEEVKSLLIPENIIIDLSLKKKGEHSEYFKRFFSQIKINLLK